MTVQFSGGRVIPTDWARVLRSMFRTQVSWGFGFGSRAKMEITCY
jgi:hypothetical protein